MLIRTICVALSSALLAQNYSPAHFGPAEGPSGNAFPFGFALPCRYSQIHDDLPSMAISGMSFRHDWNATAFPGYSLSMDAWMSTAVTPSSGISATFDNNHGPDKTRVVFNRTYTQPPSDPANLPGQFVLDYPFDVPFVFPGGGASLCWEVQITARTNAAYILYDAVWGLFPSPASPHIATGYFGSGCVASGQVNPTFARASEYTNWFTGTAGMFVSGANQPPGGITLVCTGADKTSFLGIPLPATLPGTSCTVYSDIIVSSVVIATAVGSVSHGITFVPQPAFHGITLYSQIWGLDPTANPWGLTTSDAAIHHIVAPFATPPVSRVYLPFSLGPIGTIEVNCGLVTRFY